MSCISPVFIGKGTFVPCGKCNFCLQARRGDWAFRCAVEWKQSVTSKFVTLTYRDDELVYSDGGPTLVKSDVQRFMKRLRRAQSKRSDMLIRFFAAGEYGDRTGRPHYHLILFNMIPKMIPLLQDIWSAGNVHIGEVSLKSIYYTCKYVINRYENYEGRQKPFALMSRRPGLGNHYVSTHLEWHRAGKPVDPGQSVKEMRNFTQVNGLIARLPRYYKDKFFSARERKLLREEAIVLTDIEYLKEIDRLSKLHPDPYVYREMNIRKEHDSIESRSKKGEKL